MNQPIKTSAVMSVSLTGPAFTIARIGPTDGEQLVSPSAIWEWDVLPLKTGSQTLTMSAIMRLPVSGLGEKTVSVPSVTKDIDVEVDRIYATRGFLVRNWRYSITTLVAIAAVVAAAVVHH